MEDLVNQLYLATISGQIIQRVANKFPIHQAFCQNFYLYFTVQRKMSADTPKRRLQMSGEYYSLDKVNVGGVI